MIDPTALSLAVMAVICTVYFEELNVIGEDVICWLCCVASQRPRNDKKQSLRFLRLVRFKY